MNWKSKTCETCDFRVGVECRMLPPVIYPGGNTPMDYYPLVRNESKPDDIKHQGACSKHQPTGKEK